MSRLVADARFQLVSAVRSKVAGLVSGAQSITVGDLKANTDWSSALSGVEV